MRKGFDENLTLILNICHTKTHWLKRANMLVQTTKSVKERYGGGGGDRYEGGVPWNAFFNLVKRIYSHRGL